MSDSSSNAVDLPEVTVDTPPSGTLHPRRMLDRYEIIAEIAKGGMGTVYLARLSGAGGFERMMALKVMHEHLAEDETFVTMLLDEARTAAHIHHPNAVGITDVVESPVGYYLVMDYVDGFPLSHIVTHPEMSERDRIRIATRLLVDAAQGLHAAHTAKNAKGEKLGIVHRDVSPQNVLVGRDGTGRIVDFGIALAASRVASSRPGTLKGKPQYMAPEQAKGEPCDGRTDVFALGIMLWESLTYERLFYGDMDVAVLVQVMECNVPSPRERNPQIPEGLAKVAMRALSKYPEDRYATARDFAAALEQAAKEAGLFATSSDVEAIIGTLFTEELAAKDEAIKNHLDRSVGDPLPMRRGELSLVSKLFERKRHPKMRDMHTRTGEVQKGTPASGVRSRGSLEVEVAPTKPAGSKPAIVAPANAMPVAPQSDRTPSLMVVSVAVIVALAILSVGAYALSTALGTHADPAVSEPSTVATPAPPATAFDPALAEPALAEPTLAEPAVAEPAEPAPEPPVAPAAPSGHRRPRGTTTPSAEPTTPTTPPAGSGAPTFEANPYLGH